MVCKEDVLLWFKDLEGYKRIDVMYDLLNMCIPFEVRYLGSCIEEIGKHTYQELRGPTIIANDVDRLGKDPTLHLGLLDEGTRHRTVIYMSLLGGRNCACANWFYAKLFRTERFESFVNSGCARDDCGTLNELLLLFTMGLYHPAFTFEQKSHFTRLLEQLILQSDAGRFGTHNYSSPRNLSSLPLEAHTIPVKSASIMPACDTLHLPHPPPGLAPLPPQQAMQPIDYLPPPPMLARTGFPTTVVGAPEMHPFPPHSPLVSQAASPPQSRASSPHRTYMRPLSATGMAMLPPPQLMAIPHGEPASSAPPIHLDQSLPQIPPSTHQFGTACTQTCAGISIKSQDDETNHVPEDKIREGCWPANQYEMKQLNGVRVNLKQPYHLNEQMSGLKLDAESAAPTVIPSASYHSSSASSSSSMNQSPTETPSVTPAVTPQGPGRGMEAPVALAAVAPVVAAAKTPRVNGMPPAPPHIDYVTPFNNCTVPSYSMAAHAPPSSMPQPPIPRNPNCYNCGGMGHSGGDCNGHTVEDITQKPYTLEYDSPTLPDNTEK